MTTVFRMADAPLTASPARQTLSAYLCIGCQKPTMQVVRGEMMVACAEAVCRGIVSAETAMVKLLQCDRANEPVRLCPRCWTRFLMVLVGQVKGEVPRA